jgi:hypothetical protein
MIHQDIKGASAVGPGLFIGQDRCGRWVVKDTQSRRGEQFADRSAAIRFAMYECQRRPQSVVMLPDGLELDAGFHPPHHGRLQRLARGLAAIRLAPRSQSRTSWPFAPSSLCSAYRSVWARCSPPAATIHPASSRRPQTSLSARRSVRPRISAVCLLQGTSAL